MVCSAFGLDITSAMELPGRWRCPGAGLPPLHVEPAAHADVAAAWSGADRIGWNGRADGRPLIVEHGTAGDLRLRAAPSIDMHLSADHARLIVANDDGDALAAMRILLDSALFTVSLQRGYEALHAGAVATDAGLLAVMGASGSGKSSAIVALLEAGCGFHTDDVLVLRRDGDKIVAVPGPPVLTVARPAPAGLGTPIADVGDEAWLAVAGAERARPLAGIVCLAESGDAWRHVLSSLLAFPRAAERERARFELSAELAAAVPLRRLEPRSTSPDGLAVAALDWIRSVQGG